MKTKEFNRSTVKEIADRIQSSIASVAEEYGIELHVNGGKFDAGKFTLKLEGILLTADGVIVAPEGKHVVADSYATHSGLELTGNAIGSMWMVRNEVYTVMDYVTKRPKYPFSLKRTDGRLSKASADFLKQGAQLVKPTEEEFITWFTIDPDSDAVLESDVEIYDRTQGYMNVILPVGDRDADDFFDYVDALNVKFLTRALKKHAKVIYDLLFGGSTMGVKEANKRMKMLF